jgi:hypothetical protein
LTADQHRDVVTLGGDVTSNSRRLRVNDVELNVVIQGDGPGNAHSNLEGFDPAMTIGVASALCAIRAPVRSLSC